MKRLAIATLVAAAVLGAGACSSDSKDAVPSTPTTAADWDAAALLVADGLVEKLQDAKKPCSDYTHWNYPLLSADYAGKDLPIPAAVATCLGEAEEDLTIEVFADPAAKETFVAAKTKLLCNAAARKNIDYPGFPYIDGGTWIFEPDEPDTAVGAAKILGGEVKTATCED